MFTHRTTGHLLQVLAVVAATCLAHAASAQNCVPAPGGLIGWWPGDSGASDLSGGNDGVLTNGASAGVTGKVDGAFSLDGVDDHVKVSDDVSSDFGENGFTMELWFKTDTTDAGALLTKFDGLLLPYFAINADYPALVLGPEGFLEFRLYDADGQAHYSAVSTTGGFNDGQWHHLAGVRVDSANSELYVDGQLVAEKTDIANVDLNTAGDLLIGGFVYKDTTGGGQDIVLGAFEGLVDEVSVYNRALSAAQIQAIVNAGAAGKCKPGPAPMLAGVRAFIQAEVASGGIDTELETSLEAKVDAAAAALAKGNPNDAKVAMNDLKALINQVEAQTDKKITPEAAAAVIEKANAIIAALDG